MYTPSIGVAASLVFSPTRISLRKQNLNSLTGNCEILCFTKCVCSVIVRCSKKFDADWKKRDLSRIIFKSFPVPTVFNNFYYCVKAPFKTNRIFHYETKWEGLIVHKYLLLEFSWHGPNFRIYYLNQIF